MRIDATDMTFDVLNETVRQCADHEVEITGALGQRFVAAGAGERHIAIHGTPGNALAAYLNGAEVEVFGNAQDAVGDTMNDGKVVVHGNIGDAAGYAMRGGSIYVKGNAGYRAGIHMKAYRDKVPHLVVGGVTGSFLGEYQAGGVIVVLGLDSDKPIVGNFPCTGMHGGKMLLRSDLGGISLPMGVHAERIEARDSEFAPCIREYCRLFDVDEDAIFEGAFTLVTPDTNNPYKQMYVQN